MFAHGHKARLLNLLTRRTGAGKYFATWRRFYERHWATRDPWKNDYHVFNKTLQHLPFAQAHGWNARWKNGAVRVDPIRLPSRSVLRGTIVTPAGNLTLAVRCRGRSFRIVERSGADVPVKVSSRA
jgi:hypothetical protein